MWRALVSDFIMNCKPLVLFIALEAGVRLIPLQAEVSTLHPRIYVRHDSATVGKGLTVSELRSRLNMPAYARWRRRTIPSKGTEAMVERAARYLEDGNTDDLVAVRDYLKTHTFSYERNDVGGFLAGAEMATAFDWIYQELSAEDRTAIMANIVTTAESSRRFVLGGEDINHNYTYMALNTVAVCGLVLKGEMEPYNSKGMDYLAVAQKMLEGPGMVFDTWNARQGAWAEGSHYTFHETWRNLILMLAAYRSATDKDYFALVQRDYGNFLAKSGRFLIACTRPDMTLIRTGDTSPNRVQASLTVPLTMEMLAADMPDQQEAARFRSFTDALLKAYGDKAVYPAYDWGMRIFYDPNAPRSPSYKTLPLAMRLGEGTYEQIVFRNGWGMDNTHIAILAGDHFTDHQHFDKGQFLIYHRGGLAIDSGTYDGMYKRGTHAGEYAPRTLAHNCLLIYDPDQVFPGGLTNDGGQRVLRGLQHHHNWPSYVAHRDKEGLNTADVLAYAADESNGYDYVLINLQRAYGEKVSHYDRQFVYLPGPDIFFVFDRVSSARADFKKRWLLHFQDRPVIDGKAPEPGVHSFPNAILTTEKREGKMDLGGVTVTYDGALCVQTLLPASHDVIAIGGPGYEYFNEFNKVNYPPSRLALEADSREPGKWRIEVAPKAMTEDDQFLHVLQMAGPASKAPAETRLIGDKDGKITGAYVLSREENQVVLFSAAREGGAVVLPVSYEIFSSTPARHLLVEMPRGQKVVVEVNKRRKLEAQVTDQGVLNFLDKTRGHRRITIRAK